jgi:hypothetical protein
MNQSDTQRVHTTTYATVHGRVILHATWQGPLIRHERMWEFQTLPSRTVQQQLIAAWQETLNGGA